MIDGEYLSDFFFADGIVLTANSTSKLQEILQDTHDVSKPVGLKMDNGNTKVMCNKHVKKDYITVDGKKIESDNRYFYLGKMMT